MRMTVGYLATPSGADGIALGSLLATTLGSDLDICLVLEETRRVPAKGGIEIDYDEIIAAKARQWLIEAMETVPDGIAAEPVLAKSESFAEGLLAVADDTGAEMIVVGAAGGGSSTGRGARQRLSRHSNPSGQLESLSSSHAWEQTNVPSPTSAQTLLAHSLLFSHASPSSRPGGLPLSAGGAPASFGFGVAGGL